MASTVILPFNNNPSTISVKTSSYTVPAGKYAYLINESPNIALNGTNLYQTISLGASNSGVTTKYYYGYKSAIYVASGTVSNPGGATSSGGIAFGTLLSAPYTTTSPNAFSSYNTIVSTSASPGGSSSLAATFSNTGGELIAWVTLGGGGAGVSLSATIYAMNHTPYGMWVPSGTVINSARFTIIEYNV